MVITHHEGIQMRFIPGSAEEFSGVLKQLRKQREIAKSEQKNGGEKRQQLRESERKIVFEKTAGRCHICGGKLGKNWQADHVLSHSAGGTHAADNYLPAHTTCNNYRWDYLSEEFQLILKLGVWARTQVEKETSLGKVLAEGFLSKERQRLSRSTKGRIARGST